VPDLTRYRQIKTEVFRRIRSGQYGPGELLPGEVELAAEFGCARATVNRAMQELSDDGIIDRKRKGGSRVKIAPLRQVTFEIPVIRAEIEARSGVYAYRLVLSSVEKIPEWLAKKWKSPGKASIRHLQCIHFADGQPFQFENRWINLETVPEAKSADFSVLGPNEWLLAQVPYTNAEIVFSAINADETMAAHLNADLLTPLFLMERTTWLADKAVTYVRLAFSANYRMTARY
jgi:GntR family transcriptional regulator, histidine utilization repressor